MRTNKFIIYIALLLSIGVQSCKVLNPSILLRTPKNYEYDKLKAEIDTGVYVIAPNDKITVQVFANDGFRLIDMTNFSGGSNQGNTGGGNMMMMMQGGGFRYLIEYDGTAKLPILGRVKLSGYTIREAQLFLEEQYGEYYNNPFCLVAIVNRRVLIFPGSDGQGRVVPISEENITLMEALATAGGVAFQGKSYKIKVVRGNNTGTPEVFLIDLSTIEGLEQARMVMQANDIVYVEPRRNYAADVLRELQPLFSLVTLITTSLLIFAVFNNDSQ